MSARTPDSPRGDP